jgi:hypothetical protein
MKMKIPFNQKTAKLCRALLVVVLALACNVTAAPMTVDNVTQMLKDKKSEEVIKKDISLYKVTTSAPHLSELEKRSLIRAGASDELISVIEQNIQFTSNAVPSVVINEVNSDSKDGEEDFIELMDKNDSHILKIPAGTIIKAKSFLVIYPDLTSPPAGAPSGSIAMKAFGLGKGDKVRLLINRTETDSINWPATEHAHSWGRSPDGGKWTRKNGMPTPGFPNAQ